MLKITKIYEPQDSKSTVLKHYFDIEAPLWGGIMKITKCRFFDKDGNQWMGLPSWKDGEIDGKAKYTPYVGFSKEIQQRITTAALEAVKSALKEEDGQSESLFEPN